MFLYKKLYVPLILHVFVIHETLKVVSTTIASTTTDAKNSVFTNHVTFPVSIEKLNGLYYRS